MAIILKDRVKVTTGVTGTGTVTLGAAVIGFQSFAVIGDGNQTYYTIAAQSGADFEVGIGTVTDTAGTFTLSRDTVLESSNAGSLVDFSAGTKDVFVTYPAERSVFLNAAGSAVDVLDIGTLGTSTANITAANITAGTVTTSPASGNDLVNKAYVDALVASGIHFHEPVRVESPINLNATYDNGTAGVGATLTNAGTQVALVIDGITMVVADRVLVYEQTNQTQNGVYVVTSIGSGATDWVLTRSDDADTFGFAGPDTLSEGSTFFVQEGATGAGETYTCNTVGTITFGTTNITFAQVSSAQIYSAGTGLTLSGTQFSITNTGTAGTYGSASQVPVFTTNAQGQVTSVTNTPIAITSAAVSGLAASATTDTTNASNITSGTLDTGRLSGSYTGITGVGTLAAGTWNGSVIGAVYGGTGFGSYTVGDLLFADTSTSLAKLADVAVGNALISGGVGSAPTYGKIGLATHVSGTLPVANGGTGLTSLGAGVATFLSTPTSANLAAAVTDETGSGALVFANSPTLVTPALGTPASGVVTNLTGTASININGTVGATTANTGAFTTLSASGTTTLSGNQIISVTDNSNAALRITQLGTGNALLVEDSANPDATPFVVSADGYVGIGTTSPTVPLQLAYTAGVPDPSLVTSDAAIITAENTAPGFAFVVAASSAGNRGVFKATRARGTLAAPLAPSSGDDTFSLLGAIYDGVTTLATAGINMAVDGAVSSGVAPQRLTFLTGETNTRLERMRIDAAGNVGIGTTAPGAKLNIVASTASDAVRITQTGTGNALLVEDAANPDTTPFLIDASGTVVSGLTTAVTNIYDPQTTTARTIGFQKVGTSSTDGGIASISYSSNAGNAPFYGAAYYLARSKSATRGTPGIVASGDIIGSIVFSGDDGTNFVSAAQIRSYVDGTPGTNDMPGNLAFFTTADGASLSTERMRITSAGNVGIGAATPAVKLDVVGGATSGAVNDTAVFSGGVTGVSGSGAAIYLTGGGGVARAAAIAGVNTGAGNNAHAMTFSTSAASASPAERMRIDSTGNVGIGTTSPGALLDVAGSIRSTGLFQRVDNSGLTLSGGTVFNTTGAGISLRGSSSAFNVYGMELYAGGSERMRIDSTGNVGIGTTSPASKLTVASGRLQVSGNQSATAWTTTGQSFDIAAATFTDTSTAAAGTVATRTTNSFNTPTLASTNAITVTNAATVYIANRPTAGANTTITNGYALWVDAGDAQFDANVTVAGTLNVRTAIDLADNDILRFGTGDDWELFHDGTNNYMDLNVGNLLVRDVTTTRFTFERTTGNFTATGNVTAYSDIRLKTDLNQITDALEKVEQLTGYTYTRTDTGERQTGLVAQDVQKVLPEAVVEGEHLSVAYGNMVGLLVEAVKELTARVKKLEGQ